MMLRQSDHKGGADWDMALSLARDGQGTDSYGYRSELIKLVKLAKEIQKEEALLGMKR
jgi:Ca-activated chloride channel family protein